MNAGDPVLHRRVCSLAAGALAVALLLSGCEDGDAPDPDWRVSGPTREPSSAIATAKRFAPLVYLAEGEAYPPIDASTFIWRTNLVWAVDGVCRDTVVAKRPDEHALGTKDRFREREHDASTCRGFGRYYTNTEPTRPFTNEELGAEGFYLNSDNDLHKAGGTNAPAYVQYVSPDKDDRENAGRTAYVYWFFFPYNRAVTPGGALGNHEGDWERVTVVTDADGEPERVVYSQHHTKCAVPWREVVGPDGHPVVYSATGSHGSYPKGDAAYDIPRVPNHDHTSTGKPWRTWEHLREADREQWWGYAGGWGEVGPALQALPFKDGAVLAETQTGPLGPFGTRDMSEAFRDTPCPDPVDSGDGAGEDPSQTPTTTPPPSGPTVENAIDRYEQYLHALGNQDVTTICEIAAPASAEAESQGFGTCEQQFAIVFQMIPPDKQEALKTASVDPAAVRVPQPHQVSIPVTAVRATIPFSQEELGDTTLTFQNGNWFITA
ncbi:MAG: Vps62-related protein [Actinomycetota bacterium]|nr:Vps62-related protein [Actinomycetota bacterium]